MPLFSPSLFTNTIYLTMDDVKRSHLLVWLDPYMVYMTFLVILMYFIAIITFSGTFGPKNPLLGPKCISVVCKLYCAFNPSILTNMYVFDSSIVFYAWLFVFYRFCPFWPLIGDYLISHLKYEIFEKKIFLPPKPDNHTFKRKKR